MKSLIALFSILAFLALPVTGFSQQAANTKAKPADLKALPADVESALAAGLANINLSTPAGQAQLNSLILSLAGQNTGLVAEITYQAVSLVSQSLAGNPQQAANVIGPLVNAVASAYPGQALPVVTAAVAAVPNSLNATVIPKIVSDSRANFASPESFVSMLNSVNNVAQDPAVTQSLRAEFASATGDTNSVSFQGNVEQDGEADFSESPFALVTAPQGQVIDPGMNTTDSPFLTGDQGVGTVGAQFPSSSSGGTGGGSSSNPTPAPTPVPTPAPTPVPPVS